MKETEFEYQCYYKKWLCASPILAAVICLNFLLMRLIEKDIFVYLISAAVMAVSLIMYYNFTRNKFLRKGSYTVEKGKLTIAMNGKTYEFTEINEIFGSVKSIYSSRMASLHIEGNAGDLNLKIFAKPLSENENFVNTPLYDIYSAVKENFNDLKAVQVAGNDCEYRLKKDV